MSENIILPCSEHSQEETALLFPLSVQKPSLHCDHSFFCYISRKCVCVHAFPPPFLFHTHPISTGLHSASVSVLHLTGEGLHRRTCPAPQWHLERPSIGGWFQNQSAMCSMCAWELGNRRNENGSSFSFSLPQPAYDFVVCPPLNIQAAVWVRGVKLPVIFTLSYVLDIRNTTLTFFLFLCPCLSLFLTACSLFILRMPVWCMSVCKLVSQSLLVWQELLNWKDQFVKFNFNPHAHGMAWHCNLDFNVKKNTVCFNHPEYATWRGQHSSFSASHIWHTVTIR